MKLKKQKKKERAPLTEDVPKSHNCGDFWTQNTDLPQKENQKIKAPGKQKTKQAKAILLNPKVPIHFEKGRRITKKKKRESREAKTSDQHGKDTRGERKGRKTRFDNQFFQP